VARSNKGSGKEARSPERSAAPPQATRPTGPNQHDAAVGQSSSRKILIAGLAVVVVASFGSLQLLNPTLRNGLGGGESAAGATFVGSGACTGCHQSEARLWQFSHHKLAMDHATDKSVLGDFNGASFDHYGVHSRFFRRDGKYLVETDGPDGKLATFEVKYTFGIDPLQQYLVELPDGRIQALSLAWDSRPHDQGGQRWFHLYPNEEIKHDDILHWTKLNQNWNFMCAECHSTGVRKNYDAANDRFATTWAEISVGCEACHGRGSQHLAWAREQQSWWPFGKSSDPSKGLSVSFDERHDISWPIDSRTGNAARRIAPARLRKEVETCGLCHARRGTFSEDWLPGRWLSDTHVVSPLVRGLFQSDGQMLDEVYNYASFKQSRMFAAGVTCSDCHEPHGAKLRAPGNAICLQCHASDKYAAASHHHHEAASPQLSCASCHMPERTYMVIDGRHDHSLRIPRPDISAKLGTSNACNDCHRDKTAEWAASAVERWYGPNRKGLQNYAEAFRAAWDGRSSAATLLGSVAADHNVPAFARASALTELGAYVSASNINLARDGLSDPDPMVRIGALDMLGNVPANQFWPLVAPLLSDSSRGVRIKAASLLAAVPTADQPPDDRERFDHAATEFIAAQRLNADRPEAHALLGNFYARRGQTAEAEIEYRSALRLSPQFALAAINLADLYRQLDRNAEGESVLRSASVILPADAGLHYALGLTLTRLKRTDEAIAELRRAAEIEPDRARYIYVYAVALNSAGRGDEAIAMLKDALARHSDDGDILMALATFSRDAGDLDSAIEYGEQLARIVPNDRRIASFVQSLRRQAKKPDR
jgi:predicted CXXCH cytochrome family protein